MKFINLIYNKHYLLTEKTSNFYKGYLIFCHLIPISIIIGFLPMY